MLVKITMGSISFLESKNEKEKQENKLKEVTVTLKEVFDK